jgi:hypothetical protein
MAELPPRPAPSPAPRGGWLSIILTGFVLALAAIVLFVLSLGQLLPILVIGGLVFLATAFHYLVWGWWLGKMIHREAEEEERKAS